MWLSRSPRRKRSKPVVLSFVAQGKGKPISMPVHFKMPFACYLQLGSPCVRAPLYHQRHYSHTRAHPYTCAIRMTEPSLLPLHLLYSHLHWIQPVSYLLVGFLSCSYTTPSYSMAVLIPVLITKMQVSLLFPSSWQLLSCACPDWFTPMALNISCRLKKGS